MKLARSLIVCHKANLTFPFTQIALTHPRTLLYLWQSSYKVPNLFIIDYILTEMLFAAMRKGCLDLMKKLSKSYQRSLLLDVLLGLANFIHGEWILNFCL